MIRVSRFFLIEFVERKVNEELENRGNDDTTKLIQRGNEELRTEKKYFLYGIEVHFRVIRALFIVFLTVFGVSFVLFWNTFIADELVGCDSEWDCFHKDTYFPIDNCTNYNKNNVICFQVGLHFTEGIGKTGGFLFVMKMTVNFLIYITVRLASFKNRFKYCRIIVYVILIVVLATVTLILPWSLYYAGVPEVTGNLQTPQRWIEFVAYTIMNTILIGFVPLLISGILN